MLFFILFGWVQLGAVVKARNNMSVRLRWRETRAMFKAMSGIFCSAKIARVEVSREEMRVRVCSRSEIPERELFLTGNQC